MNRSTGSSIDTLGHISQSVADIITTRMGTRVMRRDYGSQIPDLIDQPFNASTKLRAYAAIAMAVMRWEPRLRLTRVQLSLGDTPGDAVLDLEGTRVDSNEAVNLQVPLALGAIA